MKMNVIVVYNKEENKILMCLRSKEPYKGLYNLVGGKIEQDEDGLDAAYRELYEESNISKEDIKLVYIADFKYFMSNKELEVYVGRLNKDKELVEEAHKLYWIDANDDFFDMNKYAGEGIIGHIIEQVKIHKDKIFNNEI